MTLTDSPLEVSTIELRRRRHILRVVAAVVAEEGFDGATMRKIAERAGVSTGMLTYYYQNKRDLIMAMLRDAYERSVHNIDGSLEEQFGPQRIEAVFDQMLEGNRLHVFPLSFWVAYWAEAVHDEELRQFSLKSPVRDVFRRSIENAVAGGKLREDLDPELAADLLLTIWQGARVEVGLDDMEEDRVSQVVRLA
ncbi:MAG TPA: TetR/AcrR family transcriptional regulator, partial [Dehalococcoidia bacterium]|nr:TetR/AcrR family transcriptional regulator [Dehalococcoidia bacterium]